MIIPFVALRLVTLAFVEELLAVKKLVELELTVVRRIIVAEATVKSEIVVVASVVVPVTVKVFDTEDVPAVRVTKLPLVV